jgi:hypothetical protein
MINLAYSKIHYTGTYFIYTTNILNIVFMTNYHHFITKLRICKSKILIRTCGGIRGLKFLVGADAYYYICDTLNDLIKPAEI